MNFIFTLDIISLSVLIFLFIFFLLKHFFRFTITYFYLLNLIFAIFAVITSLFIEHLDNNSIQINPFIIYFLYSFYYFCMGSIFSVFSLMAQSLFNKFKSKSIYYWPIFTFVIFCITLILIPTFIDVRIILSELIRNYFILYLNFGIFFINVLIAVYFLLMNIKNLDNSVIFLSLISIGLFIANCLVWALTKNYSIINLLTTMQLLMVFLYLFFKKQNRIFRFSYFFDSKLNRYILDSIKENKFNIEFLPIFYEKENRFTLSSCRLSLTDSKKNTITNDVLINFGNSQGYAFTLEKKLVFMVCKYIKDNYKVMDVIDRINISVSLDTLCDTNKTNEIINMVVGQDVNPANIGFQVNDEKRISNCSAFFEQVSRLNNLGFHVGISYFEDDNLMMTFLLHNSNSYLLVEREKINSFMFQKDGKVIDNLDYLLCKRMNFSLIMQGVECKEQLSEIKKTAINYYCGPYFHDYLTEKSFSQLILKNE